MSNNKQSSVQWFFDQLIEHRIIIVNQTTYGDKVKPKHEILLEQAKAMHKEECKESYYESLLSNFQNFDDYYNKTFGGEQ